MQKQIPILMSTPMVQATLDGRKTMTRRIVKHRISYEANSSGRTDLNAFGVLDGNSNYILDKNAVPLTLADISCPYGKVGDILWVRESFRKYYNVDEDGYTNWDKEIIDYCADGLEPLNMVDGDGFQMYNKDGTEKMVPNKPGIHMPKAACRIWLEIIDIRVERVSDITEEDAKAEGVETYKDGYKAYGWYPKEIGVVDCVCTTAIKSFWYLWKSINGEESWLDNPWVWVISFKVLSTTGKPESL